MRRPFAGGASLVLAAAHPVIAATIEVGPDEPLKEPSEAARLAKPGDTIRIMPGEYFDCAIWTVGGLLIEGAGEGVVITDKLCQGKALFIVHADDVTIRNLTFQRARAPDRNGAGIRAEGANLTVEDSWFVNNESGILAGDNAQSRIRIRRCTFREVGRCTEGHCVPGLAIGAVAELRVEGSHFLGTTGAHAIVSRAHSTTILDSEIADGPDGSSSYLLEMPDGGTLVMEGNRLEKGPKTSNPTAAIMLGSGALANETSELVFRNNQFVNNTGGATVFIRNWVGVSPTLSGNVIGSSVTEVSTRGAWLHRAWTWALGVKAWLRHLAAAIWHAL